MLLPFDRICLCICIHSESRTRIYGALKSICTSESVARLKWILMDTYSSGGRYSNTMITDWTPVVILARRSNCNGDVMLVCASSQGIYAIVIGCDWALKLSEFIVLFINFFFFVNTDFNICILFCVQEKEASYVSIVMDVILKSLFEIYSAESFRNTQKKLILYMMQLLHPLLSYSRMKTT